MSVDMNSQGSDSNEEDYDPNCEEEEEEEDEDPGDIEDYYVGVASDVEQQGADAFDPEEYQFTCLTLQGVRRRPQRAHDQLSLCPKGISFSC